MGIMDYVIIGLGVLFLLIGLLLGMRRMLFGIVASVIAIVLAAVVMMPIGNAVMNGTDWDDKLTTALAQSMSEKMPNGNQTLVYADADGDPSTADELGYFSGGEWHPFSESLQGGALANFGTFVESNIKKNYTAEDAAEDPKTAILLLSETLTRFIFFAATFIVMWIVFGVAFWLLGKLVKQFVTGTYAGKLVDKVLGAAAGVAVIWVIAMLVFAVFDIVGALPQAAEFMSTINEMIDNSTIASFIAKNNFIAQLINVDGIIAAIGGAA